MTPLRTALGTLWKPWRSLGQEGLAAMEALAARPHGLRSLALLVVVFNALADILLGLLNPKTRLHS